jgi:oligopeptide/dipeptide ABC transporter ATP-binding protein
MPLLSVDALCSAYRTSTGLVRAVDGVSFSVQKGESLGIAGESGCGKSTLAYSLMRLLKGGEVVGGSVSLDGISLLDMSERDFNRVRWEKMAYVPQAAMDGLNPVHRIGAQIVEAIRAHRAVSKSAAWERAELLLRQVNIDPARARDYPHQLSGGMRQRAMIAMSLALDPQLIVADEPTTALDVVTQAQVLKLLRRLQQELDISIIFISHDLSTLAQACDRIMIMYAGKAVELGNSEIVFASPRHPYTRALLGAFPDLHSTQATRALRGAPPDLSSGSFSGCRFRPRCAEAVDRCRTEEPCMSSINSGHDVSCHLARTLG